LDEQERIDAALSDAQSVPWHAAPPRVRVDVLRRIEARRLLRLHHARRRARYPRVRLLAFTLIAGCLVAAANPNAAVRGGLSVISWAGDSLNGLGRQLGLARPSLVAAQSQVDAQHRASAARTLPGDLSAPVIAEAQALGEDTARAAATILDKFLGPGE